MSEENDDGGNAFPAMLPGGNYCTPGMTLKDWFAGMALSGMMSQFDIVDSTGESDIARECYMQADAMLKHREAKTDG